MTDQSRLVGTVSRKAISTLTHTLPDTFRSDLLKRQKPKRQSSTETI